MNSTPMDDDADMLAALDFSVETDETASGLDAFDVYTVVDVEAGSDLAALDYAEAADSENTEDTEDASLFEASNPDGSVTVLAYLNGAVQRVILSPDVTRMTETELADDVRRVAQLAATKATAGLYTVMLDLLAQQGQDHASADDFLQQHLQLPTPGQAHAAESEFAARYRRSTE